MFVDDTACNLASLNLMKFFNQEDGTFNVEAFRHACDIVISAQEMLVDNCSYPTDGDRRELLQVPAARARVREPRRALDGERPAVRLRRGARLRGGDHLA